MKKYFKYMCAFVMPILALISCDDSVTLKPTTDLYNIKKETVNVSADQKSLTFDSQAHFADLQFESNFWWRIDTVLVPVVDVNVVPYEAHNWFSIAPTSNFGKRPVTITLTRNIEKVDRKIILKFFSENGTEVKELELIQKASVAFLEVIPSKTEFSLLSSVLNVNLTTTENWSLKLPSWCSTPNLSGSKCRDNNIVIQVQKNETKVDRRDTIKFSGGGITQSFVIVQAGTFEQPKNVTSTNGESLIVQWTRSTGAIGYKINYYQPGTSILIDTLNVPFMNNYPETVSMDISSVQTWKGYIGEADITVSATLGENLWMESDLNTKARINTHFAESNNSDGTQNNPYVVKFGRHFMNVGKKPNSNFIQEADIDMTGKTNYVPIVNFTGVYDGGNYSISNLVMNPAINTPYGIWGIVSGANAVIRNLKIKDCTMNITQSVYPNEAGMIAGRLDQGTIDNCQSTGCQLKSSKNSNIGLGGIVGFNTMGKITNCRTYTGLISSATATNAFDGKGYISVAASPVIGGIVGRNGASLNTDTESLIENCTNYDFKIIGGGSQVGGIVGQNNFTVRACVNYALIRAGAHVGGIAGSSTATGATNANFLIENCANWGNINVENAGNFAQIGGIVGRGNISAAGTKIPTIRNCFNAGNISFLKQIGAQIPISLGGIAGSFGGGIIVHDCYNTGSVTSLIPGIQSDISGSIILGGLVAEYGTAPNVTNCYSAGTVGGSTFYSGLVAGRKLGNPIKAVNCFYLLQSGSNAYGWISSTATGTDPMGLSSSQMKDQAQFIGFDFNTVWQIDPNVNNGYPTLRTVNAPPPSAIRRK